MFCLNNIEKVGAPASLVCPISLASLFSFGCLGYMVFIASGKGLKSDVTAPVKVPGNNVSHDLVINVLLGLIGC